MCHRMIVGAGNRNVHALCSPCWQHPAQGCLGRRAQNSCSGASPTALLAARSRAGGMVDARVPLPHRAHQVQPSPTKSNQGRINRVVGKVGPIHLTGRGGYGRLLNRRLHCRVPIRLGRVRLCVAEGVCRPRIDAKGIRIRVYAPRRCGRMRHEGVKQAHMEEREPSQTAQCIAFGPVPFSN